MNANSASRTSHFIRRLGQAWHELDHAQRRLFEIRTGVPALSRRERRGGSRPIGS